MPLPSCQAGHDWSIPFRERIQRGRIITLRRVKQCLACEKIVEVFDEPHINYPTGRVKRIPFELE